jgi:transcriptional regulator with XRE-family HTH domain
MFAPRLSEAGQTCEDVSMAVKSPTTADRSMGNRLRLRRKVLGLSQEKLAQALGITFQQVQKYEKGVNRVSPSRLVDLANTLDVSVPYFFQEMSAEVEGQTPSMLMNAKALPTIENEKDPMVKRETLELVRAYYRIPDPVVRKRLAEMIKTVAKPA